MVYLAGDGAQNRMLMALDLDSGARRELVPGNDPFYTPEGYLLFSPAGNMDVGLKALPFSLESLEPTGEAFPIGAEGRLPTVSNDGTLVYWEGLPGGQDTRALVWRSRSGELEQRVGQPQLNMAQPALSPDGLRVAVRSDEGGNQDIWIHDLMRSTKTRLTFDEGSERMPTWSPDGSEIAYSGGVSSILRKASDGTGEAVVAVETGINADWSHDGSYLVYQRLSRLERTNIDFVRLDPDGSASEPQAFLATPVDERVPRLSPDGRFLAYVSNESGRAEVLVVPFPDGAGKWQVSVNGGARPRWRRDGRELFYVETDTLMAVSVATQRGFTMGQPQRLFSSDALGGPGSFPTYDVSADGRHILLVETVGEGEEEAAPVIRIVENWYEEFRDRE